MEHGAWSMEHGAWSMEHGAWSMEHDLIARACYKVDAVQGRDETNVNIRVSPYVRGGRNVLNPVLVSYYPKTRPGRHVRQCGCVDVWMCAVPGEARVYHVLLQGGGRGSEGAVALLQTGAPLYTEGVALLCQ